MNDNPRGEHSDDPAEGSEAQGEEAQERVRRQQEDDDSEAPGSPEGA